MQTWHPHRLSFLHTNRAACTGSVCPCKNPIRAIMLFSWKDIVFEKPHSQTRHFICPYNFGLQKLTSVMSFYTPAEGVETADMDTCPMNSVPAERICWCCQLSRKKSQQRSEIKCRQLLLCFLELHPNFNISYLPYLFIDDSDLTRTGFK